MTSGNSDMTAWKTNVNEFTIKYVAFVAVLEYIY